MTTETETQTSQTPDLSKIALAPKSRMMLFGATETGKSTLASHLIRHWIANQPNPRVLILDSKPRYRAEWELNGISTRLSRRYRGMDYGEAIPGSVALPLQAHGELALAWQRGHKVAIAQIDDLAYLGALKSVLGEFYRTSRSKHSQLAYADEFADYFGTAAVFGRGDPIMQTIRSGREKGLAFMGSAQRPRNIPPAALTEATAFAIFPLEGKKDRDHLEDNGIYLPSNEDLHTFYHLSRRDRGAAGLYKLNLDKRAA